MTLTDRDRQRLDAAVQSAESKTSAEVVVVVRARSGSYTDLTVAGAFIAALLAMVGALFVDFELDPVEVVPLVTLVAAFGAWVSHGLGPRIVSASRRQAQVDEAALAAFARCGVHRTAGRTGLLVYLSAAERTIRLVPDQGVVDAVPAEIRAEWRSELAAVGLAPTVEGLAARLEGLGERIGAYLPRAANDVDELQSLPGYTSAVELS